MLKNENDVSVDPRVYQIVDMMFYNKCFKAAISSSNHLKPDRTVWRFMQTLQNFKNILKEKFYVSGDQQIARDKKLRAAYKTVLLQTAAITGNYSETRICRNIVNCTGIAIGTISH